MAITNPAPVAIAQPYANNGDKAFPIAATDAGTNVASIDKGIPDVCSEPLDTTGLPVRRIDFNALAYLSTSLNFFMQNGGAFTFDATVSSAIGGYALGAKLWATIAGESTLVRSLKNNNTDNFITTPTFIGNGTSWIVDLPHNTASSLTSSGYQILSGGMILQWGKVSHTGDIGSAVPIGNYNVSLPITFPTAALSVMITPFTTSGSTNGHTVALSIVDDLTTASQFTYYLTEWAAAGQSGTFGGNWYAIGH